jgi:hypothetical protein
LDGLEPSEVPYSHVQLIIEGQDIGKWFKELSSYQIPTMLFVFSGKTLDQGNIKRIDINRWAKAIGENIAAKLTSVVNAQHAFLVLGVDGRASLFGDMLESDWLLEIVRVVFDVPVHRRSGNIQRLLNLANISNQRLVLLEHSHYGKVNHCSWTVGGGAELELAMFWKKSPIPVQGKEFNFMIIPHSFYLALVASLHISQYLQIAETSTTFKDSAEDHVVSVKGEVDDEGMMGIALELKVIDQSELGIEDAEKIGAWLKQIVFLFFRDVEYLLDAIGSAGVNNIHDLILVADLGIGGGDNLVLLKDLVLIVGLIDASDIFNDIFRELWPFQMAVPVDVDCLKELNQVRHEVVLANLILGGVQFLHEVEKGGKLQSRGIKLELLLEDLHVLLGKHGHDALHVLFVRLLLLEDVTVQVEVFDQLSHCPETHYAFNFDYY